jgi:hypothetical protein
MASISQLTARLIDLFGSPSTANPSKLLNNLTITPSGNVAVGSGTDDSTGNKLQLAGTIGINNTAANNRATNYYTSGSVRWSSGTSGTAESGSNAGSNWFLNRYSDTGVYIDSPITIARSTGVITSTSGVTSVATSSWTGDGYGQFRAVYGNYGAMIRNDGTQFYILGTASGSPYGSWTAYRPFVFNLSTGAVQIAQDGSACSIGSRPTFNGYTAIDSGNIGSQSVNYAGTSGTCNGNAATASSVGGVSNPVSASGGSYISQYNFASIHVQVGGGNEGNQGGNFSWNDGNGDGGSWLCNNQGGGSAGWILRTVNSNNTVELGRFTITAAGAGSQGSDIRLKDEVETIPDALDKICSIRGVSYKYKTNGEYHYGVIAQEIQPYFPYAVNETHYGEDDPSHHDEVLLGVHYSDLVGPLIEAVKELKAIVDKQSEDIASLKQQLGKQ